MITLRIGDAALSVRGDAPLVARFRRVFADCETGGGALPGTPAVRCVIERGPARSTLAAFEYDGAPRDVESQLRQLGGAELDFQRHETDRFSFPTRSPWRGAVANCAMNLAFAVQPHAVFLHAASVSIGGKAALFVGRKCAGKSTTAMTLAARGHRLLGDEIAAIRVAAGEVVPVPRAISVRAGRRSARVESRLARVAGTRERFRDGSLRMRYRVSELFEPTDFAPVPLVAVFFLQGIGEATCAERFTPTMDHVRLLEPLGSQLWTEPAAIRRFQLLRTLAGSACHSLHLGPPDECADHIETIMGDL